MHKRPIIALAARQLRAVLPCAVALILAVLSPTVAPAAEITVFAAASMKTALDEIAADWSRTTGHSVALSYDASSKLAKQIQNGAPADLFVSAAPEWMDLLAAEGLIDLGTRRDLVSNRLVLVAHDKAAPPVAITRDLDLKAMLRGGRLSMAMVGSVPAGQYGKAALEHLGLWPQVQGDIVESENVRAALALVELGEAPLGIVYASDAVPPAGRLATVAVIGTFPDSSHPPIRYPAARIAASMQPEALAFLDQLSSPKAMQVFAANGFVLLAGDD